jgi:hypothetical protein
MLISTKILLTKKPTPLSLVYKEKIKKGDEKFPSKKRGQRGV